MAIYHLIHPRSHLSGQYGIDTPWQADQVRQLLAFIQRVRDTFPVLPGIDDGLSEATAMLVLEQVLPGCRALTCSLSCSAAAARRLAAVPVNLVQVWYEVAAVTSITTLYQLSMAMGVGLSDVSHALAQVLLRQAESVYHAEVGETALYRNKAAAPSCIKPDGGAEGWGGINATRWSAGSACARRCWSAGRFPVWSTCAPARTQGRTALPENTARHH